MIYTGIKTSGTYQSTQQGLPPQPPGLSAERIVFSAFLTEKWKLGNLGIRFLVFPLNSKNAFLCRGCVGHGFIFRLLYSEIKCRQMHKHPHTHMFSGIYVWVGNTQQACLIVYVGKKSPMKEAGVFFEVCGRHTMWGHCSSYPDMVKQLSASQVSTHEKAATRLSSKIQMFFLYIIASWHINTALWDVVGHSSLL